MNPKRCRSESGAIGVWRDIRVIQIARLAVSGNVLTKEGVFALDEDGSSSNSARMSLRDIDRASVELRSFREEDPELCPLEDSALSIKLGRSKDDRTRGVS